MDIRQAYLLLNINPDPYFKRMGESSRKEKINIVNEMVELGKKQGKLLLAKNHPDKGGDVNKYKKINSAIDFIQKEAESFKSKMMDLISDSEEKAKNRIFIQTK